MSLIASASRRRLLVPLIVLAVAAAIAVWASARETRRMNDVRQMVIQLVREVCSGQETSAALKSVDPVLRTQLAQALRSACARLDSPSEPDIVVISGDRSQRGHLSSTATHTAMIRAEGSDILGFRLHHSGDSSNMSILGYWIP